ncbi:serine/threonine-protein kinase H2-like [Amblyomma americanum]
MVMELATGGSLQDKLEVRAPFVETDAARVIHMLTCGLAHLHGLGIAHRNLEPENVLYEHPGAGAKVLITEFGLASAPTAGREACMHTVCEGKLRYMAPEMVSRRPYTHAVDMWALGVITHVLLTGVLPFDAHSDAAVVQLIMGAQLSVAPEAWEHVSEHAQSVVDQLLQHNASHRPSAAQLLEHPWFAAATTARMMSAPPQTRSDP